MAGQYCVLPDEGLADLLAYEIQKAITGVMNLQLLAFTLPLLPDSSTVFGDLVEATFNGYSRVTIDRSLWTTPIVVASVATSTWGTTPITWNCIGGGQSIAGFCLFDPASSKIRKLDVLAAPVAVAPGESLTWLPRWTKESKDKGPPP